MLLLLFVRVIYMLGLSYSLSNYFLSYLLGQRKKKKKENRIGGGGREGDKEK